MFSLTMMDKTTALVMNPFMIVNRPDSQPALQVPMEERTGFRLDAAASNLRNWSQLKPDLYSYHTSVNSTMAHTRFVLQSSYRREPQGSQSFAVHGIPVRVVVCKFCRFCHCCNRPECGGPHCRIHCR